MNRLILALIVVMTFGVKSVYPQTVTGVTPNCGAPGNFYNLTITGSKTEWTLSSYYVVVFSGAGLSATNVAIINDSVLTAELNISPSAMLGIRDMDVLDQFNNSYFLQDAFTVSELCYVEKLNNQVADGFFLGNNFPNPYNPVTKINFGIPVAQNVTFYVFDLQGRIIEEVNLGRKAAGQYQVTWDASRLASGTYFYGLKTNDFAQFKRMILVK